MISNQSQILTSPIDEKLLPEGTIVDVFELRTANSPDKTIYYFLEDGINVKEEITYAEMNRKVKGMAAYLQANYKKGDRALLLFPNGLEFIISLFACFYSGIVGVPAYPPRKNRLFRRFESIINDCDPAFILATSRIRDDLQKNFSTEPSLKEKKIEVYEEIENLEPENWTMPDLDPDDLVFLQYTSGSTGTPNGVMLTHRNLIVNSEFIKQAFGHDEDVICVHWLPGFHDMGLIGALLQPLYCGGSNTIIPPGVFLMRPQSWLKAISKFRATTSGGPNFSFDYCVDRIKDEDIEGLDLTSVNPFYSGAEPVREKTLENFAERFKGTGLKKSQFYPCYGMAESVLIITGTVLDEEPLYFHVDKEALKKGQVKETSGDDNSTSFVGCGKPFMGATVAIVDTEKYTIAERGSIGEIWTMGPSVTKGYWNNPERTRETFEAYLDDGSGPWLRTGDLGFIEKGQLFITGRKKDLIIIRGRNYHPTDIELSVEETHQAINKGSVAAFSVDTDHGEQLAVAAEIKRTFLRDFDKDEVFDAIRSAITSDYQVEAYAIELLYTNSLPKTSSGKIQRFECRNGFMDGTLKSITSWKNPSLNKPALAIGEDTILTWMKEWIAGKLDIDKDTIDETVPVDKLGLDSVMAVVMAKDAEEEFGIEWPLDLFLEETTLERIAKKGSELLKS